ncbi:3-phenylpropionate MFS transporter [Thorsellia anophelis]|uniref:MFS transporter, PPP family, 3-phenylpropionic acid transporter n=1 Tax=Thorsellia anophelis DSM 18579 TaxID=1123402 RepID=A0A1I0BTA1_9GAMM|nr:3-phenylpropionate MFS transporter [Thorsellia anophelis]SET09850.1 MFS transporter, PPP family, 3-phenylpropionic acid transporter [Thorsellia anophelis DSM 18579]
MQNTLFLLRNKLSPNRWLSFSYLTFFMSRGILIPYWAKWLQGLGYTNQDIGNMIAISLIARSLGTLIVPLMLKKSEHLIPSLRILGILGAMTASAFLVPLNWVLLLLLMVLYNFIISPCIPLTDSLSAAWQKKVYFEYGKVRLWGSIGFIIASTGVGILLDLFDYKAIIICLLITQITFVISTFLKYTIKPDENNFNDNALTDLNQQNKLNNHKQSFDFKALFLTPSIILVLLSIMLVQGSHAAYYSFAATYWSDAGYSDTIVGMLIAFSVGVEILFFAFGHKLVSRWTIRSLLICSAIFTVLRWILMANFTFLPTILLMQSFHAFTYVMGHMAIMRFISQYTAQEIIYLQAAYATMASGVGLAIFTALSGVLLSEIGTHTFYVMAGIAFIGLCLIPSNLTRQI